MKTKRFLLLPKALLALAVFTATAFAGDLNPPGPPAPTMKTLDKIPPSWDQILPAAERFKLVMSGAAVLDKETGLVWDKSPATTTQTWLDAKFHCNQRTVGNRKGWGLPTVQELASLVDPTVPFPGPTLPAGHPFTNVQPDFYWSATANASNPVSAWVVGFDTGFALVGDRSVLFFVWCVRGGQGVDPK